MPTFKIEVNPLETMNSLSRIFIFLVLGAVAGTSCVEKSIEQDTGDSPVDVDSTKAAIVNVSGKLFSIPSPIQTALLIKETKAEYVGEQLSDPAKVNTYATNTKRAMNLGVYGADMAYASLYEDGQLALRYFKALEKLAQELGITGAIDKNLINRLGANAGRPDSLLLLSGTFYEAADAYLKENERYDLASLILFGGWIESTYLTSVIALEGNEKARRRLAEQKQALMTLNEVMDHLADKAFMDSEAGSYLDSLNTAYDAVSKSYTYVEPQTDVARKTTHIRSKTSYDMDDKTADDIARLLNELRKEVTQ